MIPCHIWGPSPVAWTWTPQGPQFMHIGSITFTPVYCENRQSLAPSVKTDKEKMKKETGRSCGPLRAKWHYLIAMLSMNFSDAWFIKLMMQWLGALKLIRMMHFVREASISLRTKGSRIAATMLPMHSCWPDRIFWSMLIRTPVHGHGPMRIPMPILTSHSPWCLFFVISSIAKCQPEETTTRQPFPAMSWRTLRSSKNSKACTLQTINRSSISGSAANSTAARP